MATPIALILPSDGAARQARQRSVARDAKEFANSYRSARGVFRSFGARALGALLAALALGACTRVGTAPRRGTLHPWTQPDTVRIGMYEEPDTLNPVISSMAFTSDVAQLLYDGLIRYDARGRAIPDLARELPSLRNGGISRDGRTITYHLMPAARWSDGVPVTARDVIFTWRAIMNPRNRTATRTGYDRIAAIDAPDPHTVRLRLTSPYAPALYLFRDLNQGAIVPEHVLARYSDINRVPFNTHPVGSGPYILRVWHHGSEMRFDANDHYFRGAPQIPHVVVRFITDQNTLLAQLRTHEIDVGYDLSLQQIAQLRALAGVRVADSSTLHWEHLNFNVRRPPLDDRAVRVALCTAIDERTIFEKVYHGLGRAAPVHFNPDFGWGDPKVRYYRYDPRAAAQQLEAAGWKLGSDGTRYKGGKPLAFTLSTVAGVKAREAIEVLLQNAWHALGADVEVKNFPAATLFAPAAAGGVLYGGKTDVAIFTWQDVTPDPDDTAFVGPKQLPPSGENATFYVNPQLGRLELAGVATYDPAKRKPIYAAIGRMLIADVPEYVLDWLPEVTAANVDLHGPGPTPVGSDLWNIASWSYGPKASL